MTKNTIEIEFDQEAKRELRLLIASAFLFIVTVFALGVVVGVHFGGCR